MSSDFKIPSLVPQDLQLILDIVSEAPALHAVTQKREDSVASTSSIASSDSEDDSEEEIEETLVVEGEKNGTKNRFVWTDLSGPVVTELDQ